jgi:hypothetical protein
MRWPRASGQLNRVEVVGEGQDVVDLGLGDHAVGIAVDDLLRPSPAPPATTARTSRRWAMRWPRASAPSWRSPTACVEVVGEGQDVVDLGLGDHAVGIAVDDLLRVVDVVPSCPSPTTSTRLS